MWPRDVERGLENRSDELTEWPDVFGDSLLAPVPGEERSVVVSAVEDQLRDDLYRNGTWIVDYRRFRVVAFKSR